MFQVCIDNEYDIQRIHSLIVQTNNETIIIVIVFDMLYNVGNRGCNGNRGNIGNTDFWMLGGLAKL